MDSGLENKLKELENKLFGLINNHDFSNNKTENLSVRKKVIDCYKIESDKAKTGNKQLLQFNPNFYTWVVFCNALSAANDNRVYRNELASKVDKLLGFRTGLRYVQ